MGTITLSVPDELKSQMDQTDWINWSSVARRAFAQTLTDLAELETMRKVREISEIDEKDNRQIKESVVKETIKRANTAVNEIKTGKRKTMTVQEFDTWSKKL